MSGEGDPESVLFAMPKFGAGVGLHRMASLIRDLRASPWMAGLDAIKVTGSNGKGSVCAMSAAMLDALGVRAGLYTSPHLRSFHERIVVGGAPISDADLARSVAWLEERAAAHHAAHPGDTIGAFEAFTALAMHHFAEVRPGALVVEAGIGGRYDSTRVVPGSIVALTSVDLEHTRLLGDTTDLIAYDKIDLCPDGGVLVAGALDPELYRRVAAYCELRRIRLVSAPHASVIHGVALGASHMTVDVEIDGLRLRDLRVALQGPHQVINAIVAVLLVREWASRHRPGLGASELSAAVRGGLSAVRWPGRFERVHADPEVFVDVGHSPDAIDVLVRTVRGALAGRRLVLVTGVSHDKAVEPIVARLVAVADEVICTRAHHKGSPVAEIERIVRAAAPGLRVGVAATIEEAMSEAVRRAKEEGATVLVGGGLFLAAEATEALAGRDPRALRFF